MALPTGSTDEAPHQQAPPPLEPLGARRAHCLLAVKAPGALAPEAPEASRCPEAAPVALRSTDEAAHQQAAPPLEALGARRAHCLLVVTARVHQAQRGPAPVDR